MWRRLLILVCLLLALAPPATAARTPGQSGAVVCATLTMPTSPSAGGNRINLETFVPDPGCWLQDTAKEVRNRNLYDFSADIAKFIVVASLLYAALKAIPTRSVSTFMRTLAVSVVVFYAADTYDRQSGLGWLAADTMMSAWTTVYTESSRVGQAMLDQNVANQVKDLDTEFQRFVVASMTIQSVAGLNGLFGNETDPTMLDTAYQRLQDQFNKREINPLLGNGTNVAYFLLLGLFSIFAALVYSSGLVVVITIIALPISLALSVTGSTQFLRTIAVMWLSNVITILILPIFMAILIGTMLKAPIATLKDNLAYNATLASDTANQIKQGLDACSGVMFLTCKFDRGLDGLIDNAMRGIEASFMGVTVGVFAILVVFSVAVTQLRRIPSTVDRIFGTMGGGESSGVKTDFVDAPKLPRARPSGGSSSSTTTNNLLVVSPGQAAGAGRGGGGGGGIVTQMPKGPSLPPGGSAPTARVILSNALPAPGRKP